MKQENKEPIHFETKPFTIGTSTIIKLPETASMKLPSRGMTMVEGTMNGVHFQTALEPDGKRGHWFQVEKYLQKTAGIKVGETVTIDVELSKEWPEPTIPDDLAAALKNEPKVNVLWMNVTPAARWDWIRWIRATNNPDTRKKRIEVAFSKLKAGMRRPCCFNRNMCTDFTLSKNGILLDPVA